MILEKFLEDEVPMETPITYFDGDWVQSADSAEYTEKYIDLPKSSQKVIKVIHIY
jgi:hypothetical protein